MADRKPKAKTEAKKKGGRPRKEIAPEQVEQIEKLAAVLTQDQIADFLGMSDVTLRARMKDDPAILAAYARGRARAFAGAGQTLLKQGLSGNAHALIFYLKSQAGWKETQVQEHTGDALPVLVVKREE
jgi:hypothetical protein